MHYPSTLTEAFFIFDILGILFAYTQHEQDSDPGVQLMKFLCTSHIAIWGGIPWVLWLYDYVLYEEGMTADAVRNTFRAGAVLTGLYVLILTAGMINKINQYVYKYTRSAVHSNLTGLNQLWHWLVHVGLLGLELFVDSVRSTYRDIKVLVVGGVLFAAYKLNYRLLVRNAWLKVRDTFREQRHLFWEKNEMAWNGFIVEHEFRTGE